MTERNGADLRQEAIRRMAAEHMRENLGERLSLALSQDHAITFASHFGEDYLRAAYFKSRSGRHSLVLSHDAYNEDHPDALVDYLGVALLDRRTGSIHQYWLYMPDGEDDDFEYCPDPVQVDNIDRASYSWEFGCGTTQSRAENITKEEQRSDIMRITRILTTGKAIGIEDIPRGHLHDEFYTDIPRDDKLGMMESATIINRNLQKLTNEFAARIAS